MTTASPRIVVGVDGSPASVEALRWAAKQAALTGGNLEMVTSWQVPTQYGNDFYGDQFDWAELAQRSLDTATKEAGDGTPVAGTQTVVQGSPAHVLVDASAGAELLVVGTRGHGGFAGLLLGSVSEYVIAHARCPVLVVRQQPE
jgi:nucleotide-binding universal stress UspA family protein